MLPSRNDEGLVDQKDFHSAKFQEISTAKPAKTAKKTFEILCELCVLCGK
jgi:hypothetical protein